MSAAAISLLIAYVFVLAVVSRISFRRGYHRAIDDVVVGTQRAETYPGSRTNVRRR